MTESVGGFFGATRGRGISFPNVGDSVTGTIVAVHPPEQSTDPATNTPAFDRTGKPKMQVRIDLETAQRDPEDPDDDGARTLYVRGWMRGSIADALREVGETEPKPGGVLTVTFTHQEKPTSPGLSGIKKFTAAYKPPPSGVADHFGTGGRVEAPPVVAKPVKPADFSDAAWAAMDEATQRTVAKAMSGSDEPPPY
jgi:hypothetical protein